MGVIVPTGENRYTVMNPCRLLDYNDCHLWRNVQPRSEWKSHARRGGIRSVLWVCSDV